MAYAYVTYGNTDKNLFFRALHKELQHRGVDVQDVQFESIDDKTTILSFKKNKNDQPMEIVLEDNINNVPWEDVVYTISKEMGWFN